MNDRKLLAFPNHTADPISVGELAKHYHADIAYSNPSGPFFLVIKQLIKVNIAGTSHTKMEGDAMGIILGIKAEIAITTIFNRLAQCIALSGLLNSRGNAFP